MESSLKGKRVVISGASSGLGAECALAFSRIGAVVVLIARRKYRLAKLRAMIRRLGGDAIDIVADISRLSDLERTRVEVNSRLGGVDILINNAGMYPGDLPLISTLPEEWSSVLNTNLRAAYVLSRAFVPAMIQNTYGRVVNVISTTNTVSGECAYRISKIGLEVMTAALGLEVRGTSVAAMAFNPGWMRTEMSGDGRSPRHAAASIVQLVTRKAVFTNGKTFDLCWIRGKSCVCQRRRRPGIYGCRLSPNS